MMNLKQVSQPTERVGIGKRISDLWNSRNRVARLIMLATLGLVLNCCCLILPIPLSGTGDTLAAKSDVSVNTVAAPAFTTAQDPLAPAGLAISAGTEFDHNRDGRVACMNFNAQVLGVAHLQFNAGAKGGRSCK